MTEHRPSPELPTPLTDTQKFEFVAQVRELLSAQQSSNFNDNTRSFNFSESTVVISEMDYGFLREVSMSMHHETSEEFRRFQYSVDIDTRQTNKNMTTVPKLRDLSHMSPHDLALFTRESRHSYEEGMGGFTQADFAGVMATLAACREQASS